MAKLPQVKSKEAIKALERAGFVVQRIKCGHYILKKGNLRVIVPYHSTGNLKPGTLSSIIKEAGLSVEEFIGYL